MKADIYAVDGKKNGTVTLPKQFSEAIRPDVIKKAHAIIEANQRQQYGAYVGAGIRAAAEMSRRRKKFKSSYGIGISRVPRKHFWRRGTQFGFMGAFAPGTVKGRKAHPAKAARIFERSLNVAENRLAIRSAMAATIHEHYVKERGHRFTELISVIENKAEALTKTKDVTAFLTKLQLTEELERVAVRKVRSGRGTMRNRKYKTKKGPLLVVSKPCALTKAAENIAGIDICEVRNMNVQLLAPGGVPGRLTLFTEAAVKALEEQNLFFKTVKKPKETKVVKKAVKKIVKKVVKKTAGKKQ